ncbi:MAG: RNA-binding protein [Firmicutes bacterium]|nr:RNA-binding protein [Bacillota bacterium]
MNREEQLLSAILQDKYRQCVKRSRHTWSGFLTPAEAAEAEEVCRALKADFVLDGGYADAERRICIFRPQESWDEEPSPICVLRISIPKGSPALTHRDYLGSLLGLGIERSLVGDILVRDDGADAVVLSEMAEYLAQNLTSVGRAGAFCQVLDISELRTGEQKTEDIRDTVASLRLDSICAAAFRTARGKAQEAIRAGLVSVNGRQVLKPDMELCENDRVSCRGKGKAALKEIGGRTRKDRISVIITIWK